MVSTKEGHKPNVLSNLIGFKWVETILIKAGGCFARNVLQNIHWKRGSVYGNYEKCIYHLSIQVNYLDAPPRKHPRSSEVT